MKKSRILVLFLFVVGGFTLVLSRAAYLQIFPDERLRNLRAKQFETTITLRSKRGAVVDRNGRELAMSVPASSVFADPQIIQSPRSLSRKLSKILNVSAEEIHSKLSDKKKRFVWLQRQVTPLQERDLRKLKERGLGFVEESKRVFPNGRLAGAVLGFVGRDGQGLGGIEARWERELAGESRRLSLPRDARGRPLLVSGHVLAESLDGADLELTLDHELQFVLERELRRARTQFQAQAAWGLILDPHTGEVLALGQEPGFDPERALQASDIERRNRLVGDVYEPGSIMKPLVVAQALEKGKIQVGSRFFCEGGRMTIGDRVIREAEAKEKWGWLNVSEILAVSSNVGSVKIAQTMSASELRVALAEFGFGEKTAVELPGESRGILPDLPWRPHHFANIAFGHGVSVTALQIAAAYGAIANGGVLLRPQLVRSVKYGAEGKTLHSTTRVVRRVLSRETAEKMRILLMNSTLDGSTGVKARVPGYPVAGKTGTAQKVDPEGRGYKQGSYISSFAGFAPAHDPRFVIYVAVDEPTVEYYGSQVAAPVFARVAQFALQRSQVTPTLISVKDVVQPRVEVSPARTGPESDWRDFGEGYMPDLKGLSVRQAIRRIEGRGFDVHVRGEGGWVGRTWPDASQAVGTDKKITLFLHSHRDPETVSAQ